MESVERNSASATSAHSSPFNHGQVPEICIVADKSDWAFANIAHALKERLEPEIQVSIFYRANYQESLDMLKDIFLRDHQYDLVHFLWRCVLAEFFTPRSIGLLLAGLDEQDRERVITRISKTALTTSVYDHLYEDEDPFAIHIRRAVCYADKYSVSSEILRRIYKKLPEVPDPAAVLSDGVDLSLFSETRSFPHSEGRTLQIGWAGNSLWGGSAQHKGLHGLIVPAVKRLQSEGIPVKGHYQDRQESMVEHDSMPDYFRSLDIYVCASLNEGTPNPVLEAMATGVPIVTTDVGIVREAFGPKQQLFIVKDRNSDAFYTKLRQLATDADLRKELAQENLQRIQSWGWDSMASNWKIFIELGIQTGHAKSSIAKKSATLHSFHDAGVELLGKDAQIHHLEHYSGITQTRLNHANAVLNTRSHRLLSWLTTPVSRWKNRSRQQ